MDFSKNSDLAKNIAEKYLSETLAQKMFIFIIMLSVFFGLIVFLYYNSIKKVETLLSKNLALYNETELIIPSTSVFSDNSLKESYILYLNIDNMAGNGLFLSNFGNSKSILRRADGKFEIKYNPKKNCILLVFTVYHLDVIQELQGEEELDLHPRYEIIEVCNIPYHTWFQLVVTIDNRNVNVFINKLLIRSYTLTNVPELSKDSIVLGKKNNNPNLFIGRLEYSPGIVTMSDINALYFRNMRFLKLTDKERRQVQINGYKLLHKDNEIVDDLGQSANLNIQGCYLKSKIEPYLSNTIQTKSIKRCSDKNQDNNFMALGNGMCSSISDHNVEQIKTGLPPLNDDLCMEDGEVKLGSKDYVYISEVDKED